MGPLRPRHLPNELLPRLARFQSYVHISGHRHLQRLLDPRTLGSGIPGRPLRSVQHHDRHGVLLHEYVPSLVVSRNHLLGRNPLPRESHRSCIGHLRPNGLVRGFDGDCVGEQYLARSGLRFETLRHEAVWRVLRNVLYCRGVWDFDWGADCWGGYWGR
jgi:hypothetical protein